jgi:putative transposase
VPRARCEPRRLPRLEKRPPSPRTLADDALKKRIAAAHEASRRTYGVPRIHAELRAQGVVASRKRVARLMRELGLEGVSRRRGRRRPSGPAAQTAVAPDLVRRSFRAEELDLLWLADIT